MNNFQISFADKLTDNKVRQFDVKPDLSATLTSPHEYVQPTVPENPSDDKEFINALENYLRKSRYDDYTYLPRWALWS